MSEEGKLILVVEDEEAVRELACDILEMYGFRFLAAGGGDEALAQLAEHGDSIDLVLTDMLMPGLSGRQLAGRIREDHPAMRILFMTGLAGDPAAEDEAVGPGEWVLEKPFSPDQLAEKVQEVIDAPLPG
jgi:CheY-like chemotaxis protein